MKNYLSKVFQLFVFEIKVNFVREVEVNFVSKFILV